MDAPFLGMIIPWPMDFAPSGWAFCNGQIIQVNQNTALYSLIGNTYGGSGTSTFALPDLRGRTIIGAGAGAGGIYTFGQQYGSSTTVLTIANLPAHNHALNAGTPATVNITSLTVKQPVNTDPGTVSNPNGAFPASGKVDGSGDTVNNYNAAATANAFLAPATGTGSGTVTLNGNTGATGSAVPFSNVSPAIAMNYIIALTGLYPTRD